MSFDNVKHIVVVGDGQVGKTSLLFAYTDGAFKETYEATIYEKEEFNLTLDGMLYCVKLYDTAGQEEYDKIRQAFYKQADAFLLCYSILERTSFDNIELKWIPELRRTRPNVPIVLVGTKKDLRSAHSVSTREGEALRKRINANTFIESSAKNQTNVQLAIHEAVRASVVGVKDNHSEDSDESCSCWCW
ncbi:ras-like GTP-binding protein RhoL [Phlebotomus argentipes]|uniref:ras-like GTP-binding protein RhoL n=1 Tax=Phlebotomus argentipes TaxID=94469 RepID=UPI0028932D96|nr:ras-like GTP-binding protein RhoL [Phlebotomus argentipes]